MVVDLWLMVTVAEATRVKKLWIIIIGIRSWSRVLLLGV